MRLQIVDGIIIVVYLIGITLFGLRFRKSQRSLRDYFLADRNIPWWAIALSIVGAETSTLTVIGTPGIAYGGNFGFLQVIFGYLAGRIVICLIFIPQYFRGEMFTAYQLIDRRFGAALHRLTASVFLITRAAAEGVRIFAVSIVIGIALGVSDVVSIAIIMALTMIYTFWAGLIGGMFLTTASHGTDQLMVQRLLAARNERESKLALLSSGVVVLFQFTLFLLMGAGLWFFYTRISPQTRFASGDRVFPTFIVDHMPHGISGLLIAAILAAAMSNLSAALISLSSTTMIDFYTRLKPAATERSQMLFSRGATVVWGFILFGLAMISRQSHNVLETGLALASVAYGGLLGVFLLGLLTRRARQGGAIAGMLCGLAVNAWIWKWTSVPWTWYVTLGTITTFITGYLASLVQRDADPKQQS